MHDTVAFANYPDMRAENFQFYITYGEQKPGEMHDGILGLAPRSDLAGPLLVESMYLQGNISE